MATIFTIGHSTHPLSGFLSLLRQHEVDVLADVRSNPYSRINPQFNREPLKQALRDAKIQYVFLGKELGARSEDPSCYNEGRVQYDRLASTEQFRSGVNRLQEGLAMYRVALMCAEKEPLECHRTLLIARHLVKLGIDVQHIHANGSLESQSELNERLLRELSLPESDLFRSHDDVIVDAYSIQERQVAYAAAK